MSGFNFKKAKFYTIDLLRQISTVFFIIHLQIGDIYIYIYIYIEREREREGEGERQYRTVPDTALLF